MLLQGEMLKEGGSWWERKHELGSSQQNSPFNMPNRKEERKDELCQVVAQFVSFLFLFVFSDRGGHTQPKLLNSHDHLDYTLS